MNPTQIHASAVSHRLTRETSHSDLRPIHVCNTSPVDIQDPHIRHSTVEKYFVMRPILTGATCVDDT
jgi:hypothetical protein